MAYIRQQALIPFPSPMIHPYVPGGEEGIISPFHKINSTSITARSETAGLDSDLRYILSHV